MVCTPEGFVLPIQGCALFVEVVVRVAEKHGITENDAGVQQRGLGTMLLCLLFSFAGAAGL